MASYGPVWPGEASWTVDSLIELAILHQPCIQTAAPNPACIPANVGMGQAPSGRYPNAPSFSNPARHLFDWQNIHRFPSGRCPESWRKSPGMIPISTPNCPAGLLGYATAGNSVAYRRPTDLVVYLSHPRATAWKRLHSHCEKCSRLCAPPPSHPTLPTTS